MRLSHQVVYIAREHDHDTEAVVESHRGARDHRSRLSALDATVHEPRQHMRVDSGWRKTRRNPRSFTADMTARDIILISAHYPADNVFGVRPCSLFLVCGKLQGFDCICEILTIGFGHIGIIGRRRCAVQLTRRCTA